MRTQYLPTGGVPYVKWLTWLRAADAQMLDFERKKVLDWLHESQQEFFAAIDGVSEEQWMWKPASDQWSVAETAEHIVLAEALLFSMVERAVNAPANLDWEEQTRGKTELIERVIAPRLGKAKSPEPIVPTGKLNQVQVRGRFERERERILKFATYTQLAVKEHTAVHAFPVFGTLNAYQWLIYVPLHTLRHEKQIQEIKKTPGYPNVDFRGPRSL